MKKILSIFLSVALVFSVCSSFAYAADTSENELRRAEMARISPIDIGKIASTWTLHY